MNAPVVAVPLAVLLAAAAVLTWPSPRRRTPARLETPASAGASAIRWIRAVAARLRGDRDRGDDIVHFVEAVGAALAAGLGPADALVLVAKSRTARVGAGTDVDRALPELVLRARTGDGLSAGWRALADELHSPQLLLLARAWALSEASGAALSGAAATAARLMRTERDRRRRSEAALAGARATIRILTLLPLGGPVLAAALGLDLAHLYGHSPAVWACLAGGVVLLLIGRVWVGRLVAAAMRGPVLT